MADAPSHTYKNNLQNSQKYIDELIKLISKKYMENPTASSNTFSPSLEIIPRLVGHHGHLSVLTLQKKGGKNCIKLAKVCAGFSQFFSEWG